MENAALDIAPCEAPQTDADQAFIAAGRSVWARPADREDFARLQTPRIPNAYQIRTRRGLVDLVSLDEPPVAGMWPGS